MFTPVAALRQRDTLLLRQIAPTYEADESQRDALFGVLRGDPSCRILNWLVTNFTKQYQIKYVQEIDGENTIFDLYEEYRRCLQRFGRARFDPFARRKDLFGVSYVDGDGRVRQTTIAQLNFMHWALRHGVIAYARGSLQYIQAHMTRAQRRSKSRRSQCADLGVRHKRRALSQPSGARVFVYRVSVDLRLDGFEKQMLTALVPKDNKNDDAGICDKS